MDKKDLFLITEVANAVSLSRSTIMRLQDRGLIEPKYVDEESGRRYYDINDIQRLLKIRELKEGGFSDDDVSAYFDRDHDEAYLYERLDNDLIDLKRHLAILKERYPYQYHGYKEVEMADMLCVYKEYYGMSYDDRFNALYEFFMEGVSKGYRYAAKPMFIIDMRDLKDGIALDEKRTFYACIPILDTKVPKEAVKIEGFKALTTYYYGPYTDDAKSIWQGLFDEAYKRGYDPKGQVIINSLIGPNTGRKIDEANYVTQFIIPIDKAIELK